MRHPRLSAPEIDTPHGWLNTERPLRLAQLRGKIVLLDFWTLGCINCQHILPDLERLEQEYPQELVVIGVHSGKFDQEKQTETIRQAIEKFGIRHPVVNDADFTVWNQYAINAWPTVVLIDPDGKIIGQKAGEGVYEAVKPHLEQLKKDFASQLNREPLPDPGGRASPGPLRFPAKLAAGASGTLWLADSGHHRVLQLSPQGKVLTVIGSGSRGFANGRFAACSFDGPQGLALAGDSLYIADTRNHAIRRARLAEGTVETVAGTGALGYYFNEHHWDEPVLPNSPWDLQLHGQHLYIASAGNHQILRLDLQTQQVYRFAGTGREALIDGPLRECAFNQPSGLSCHGPILYVADAEASAIRAIDLEAGTVRTLLGTGLFNFGDQDGPADQVLLQHCMGLAWHEGALWIADTYNGKIKRFDLQTNRVETMLTGLDEPNDLLFLHRELYVANTNGHQLLRANPQTGAVQEVQVTQ